MGSQRGFDTVFWKTSSWDVQKCAQKRHAGQGIIKLFLDFLPVYHLSTPTSRTIPQSRLPKLVCRAIKQAWKRKLLSYHRFWWKNLGCDQFGELKCEQIIFWEISWFWPLEFLKSSPNFTNRFPMPWQTFSTIYTPNPVLKPKLEHLISQKSPSE